MTPGMSEISAVYTRLARAGEAVAGATGIGLELISRRCEHLGWPLAFDSERHKSTAATFDFGRHRESPARRRARQNR